ncbi:MAG: hypothetical protein ACR2ON_02135 [Paracoccaceae bacterium]
MQVIIEVIKCKNDRYEELFNIRAVQKNGAPVGMPEEYSQYVYNREQVARAVKWVRDDVVRNEYVLDIRVNNMTAVEL